MKLLTLLLFALLAVSLSAASPERDITLATAKANAKRLAEYQRLTAKFTSAQAQVQAFTAEWEAACRPGQPRGDGGCQAVAKPAPPLAPAPKPEPAPAKPAK